MARCDLDISSPKFKIVGNASDPDLESGLRELRSKLSRDHRLSNFFPHPMPGYPQYQNKIWKWDFAPEGETSSTRKGWRLLAYVPNHNAAEPIPAQAFLCWDRAKALKGNPAKHVADALKKFLTDTVKIVAEESSFKRQYDGENVISLCLECWETVAISSDDAEVDIAEDTHRCSRKPNP